MLLNQKKSCLLIIDVQEKLTPLVLNHEKLIQHCRWLMRLSHELHVPIYISEQYPQGLGRTVARLRNEKVTATYSEKVFFSCAAESTCLKKLMDAGHEDIVIAGIETHVCIMQTALELKEMGKNVFIVVEAVSTRHEMDHRYGLKRMKAAGITLVTREMVFFEWLRRAGTSRFKELSQQFLKEEKNDY